jgi:hypothetical protein
MHLLFSKIYLDDLQKLSRPKAKATDSTVGIPDEADFCKRSIEKEKIDPAAEKETTGSVYYLFAMRAILANTPSPCLKKAERAL